MKYFGKKALSFVLSLFFLSAALFYISRLAPGDPLVSYYGDRVEKMSVEEREWAEEKLGLKDPLSVQYIRWLENALCGDFGISYKYKMDVPEVIAERAGNTLLLGGTGFVLLFCLSLLLGVFCARHEGKTADRILCRAGTVTSCIPEFTVGGEKDLWDRVRHLLLPMAVVVISHLWYYAYMVRNRILEEMRSDYVLLAQAKGLTRRRVVFGHCVRNVLPSYLSIMAVSVPHIMGGTYIVETVFSYPGLGTLSYESARYKDYNLLMLLGLLSGAVVILCSYAAQAVNEKIDPRSFTK